MTSCRTASVEIASMNEQRRAFGRVCVAIGCVALGLTLWTSPAGAVMSPSLQMKATTLAAALNCRALDTQVVWATEDDPSDGVAWYFADLAKQGLGNVPAALADLKGPGSAQLRCDGTSRCSWRSIMPRKGVMSS